MKAHDRYIQLRDLYEFTARDWIEFSRSFEGLSPAERQIAMQGDCNDYPE